MAEQYIKDAREEIDSIDEQILDLLEERARIVKDLWIKKQDQGDDLIDVDRENDIWDNLTKEAQSRDLPVDSVLQIYDRVIGMTLSQD